MRSPTSTITSKGQITIPKRIREQLGVAVGDKITFVVNRSGAVEVRPKSGSIEDFNGIVPSLPGKEHVDFDDVIEEEIAEDFASQLTESMVE